jgi:hypothetical protein
MDERAMPAERRQARNRRHWGRLLNPFWRERHVLRTRLSPPTCAQTLRSHVGRDLSLRSITGFGDRQVRSSASERGFRIVRIGRYRNDFRTQATGAFHQSEVEQGWTVVRVTLAVHPAVILVVVAVGLVVAAALVLAALAALHGLEDRGSVPLPGLPILALLLLLTCSSFVLGRDDSAGDPEFLLDFLRETLHAVESAHTRAQSRRCGCRFGTGAKQTHG